MYTYLKLSFKYFNFRDFFCYAQKIIYVFDGIIIEDNYVCSTSLGVQHELNTPGNIYNQRKEEAI